ncbi:MAG: hypothetical protein H0W73_04480 [Bacteroidetes bacterium]|nr:hypothetical protein [Bacteroidota bacterium]
MELIKTSAVLLVSLLTFFFGQTLKSQILNLDSVTADYFKHYDVIFLGEQHGIKTTDSIETKLISILKTQNTKILLEVGYDRNYALNNFFIKKDSINYKFFNRKYNRNNSKLFRLLSNSNIIPKAIDVATREDLDKGAIFDAYSKEKRMPTTVKNDIDEFYEIGRMDFPSQMKNTNLYENFYTKFRNNLKVHKFFLEKDSTDIEEYFEALKYRILADYDSSAKIFVFSNYRESFMFSQIEREIIKNPKARIISINGSAHVGLNPQKIDKETRNKSWIPLAYRTKINLNNKNVCSICLVHRAKSLFKKDYPKEMEYILNHTEAEKYYLIKLNYKGSPFEDLIGVYDYIVVY